jgi:hypothetical protein
MEQWLYDRLNENLIVVLLAGFSGFELVRRLLHAAWTTLQNFPLEATIATIGDSFGLIARRSAQVMFSIFATQSAIGSAVEATHGKFAKEQLPAWPEAYRIHDLPLDMELDQGDPLQSNLKVEPAQISASISPPIQLRLCGGDCSGL